MNKRLYSKLILTALAALSNIAYAGPVDNLAIEKEILFSLDEKVAITKLTATNNGSQEVSFSKYDVPKVCNPSKYTYAIRETIHNNKFAWIKKVARPVVSLVRATWDVGWPVAGLGLFGYLANKGFKNWDVTTEESFEVETTGTQQITPNIYQKFTHTFEQVIDLKVDPTPVFYGLIALWFAYETVYRFNQADTKYRLYEPWMQSLRNEQFTLQPGESVSMYAVVS